MQCNGVNFARFLQHTSSLSSNRRLANSKHTFPFWNKSKVEKSQTNLSNSEHTVPFWNQFTPNLKRSPVVDTALLHTHTICNFQSTNSDNKYPLKSKDLQYPTLMNKYPLKSKDFYIYIQYPTSIKYPFQEQGFSHICNIQL